MDEIIQQIKSYALLPDGWDNEGAKPASLLSIQDAIGFIGAPISSGISIESMLLASGNVALYWNLPQFYGDIEFLGYGRIAYYIKVDTLKYKGIFSTGDDAYPYPIRALLKHKS